MKGRALAADIRAIYTSGIGPGKSCTRRCGPLKFQHYRVAEVELTYQPQPLRDTRRGATAESWSIVKIAAILLFILFVVLTILSPFLGSSPLASTHDGEDGPFESDEDLLARERAALYDDDDA